MDWRKPIHELAAVVVQSIEYSWKKSVPLAKLRPATDQERD